MGFIMKLSDAGLKRVKIIKTTLSPEEESRLKSVGATSNCGFVVLYSSKIGCVINTDMCLTGISADIASKIKVEYV